MFEYFRNHQNGLIALVVVGVVYWLCLVIRGSQYFLLTAPAWWWVVVGILAALLIVIGLFPWRVIPQPIQPQQFTEPALDLVLPAMPEAPDGETPEQAAERTRAYENLCATARQEHAQRVAAARAECIRANREAETAARQQWWATYWSNPPINFGGLTTALTILLALALASQCVVNERRVTGYAQPVAGGDVRVSTRGGGLYSFPDASARTCVDISTGTAVDHARVVRYGWGKPEPVMVDMQLRSGASRGEVGAWNARRYERLSDTEVALPLHEQLAAVPSIGHLEVYSNGARLIGPEGTPLDGTADPETPVEQNTPGPTADAAAEPAESQSAAIDTDSDGGINIWIYLGEWAKATEAWSRSIGGKRGNATRQDPSSPPRAGGASQNDLPPLPDTPENDCDSRQPLPDTP